MADDKLEIIKDDQLNEETTNETGHDGVVSSSTFSIQDSIDAMGFGWFQFLLSVLLGLAFMADAMEMMILSILSPVLHCEWAITPVEQALITTVVFVGMGMSSSFWGWVCDKYGRRKELVLCSIFTFYYGILSAFAPSYKWLLMLRFLVGFGIGGAPQAITFYAEFLPTASRGTAILLIEIFWAIGTCFEVVLALLVMEDLGWRWLLGLSALPLIVFSAFCVWLPESPRFEVARGRPDLAMQTLHRIARTNRKPLPSNEHPLDVIPPATAANGSSSSANGSAADNAATGNGTSTAVGLGGSAEKRGAFGDLFTTEHRRTTLLLWFVWFTSAFAYYGIVLLTTELLESETSCNAKLDSVRADSMHSECLVGCKGLTRDDYVSLLWTTLAEFPGIIITIFVIDKFGRKRTLASEFFGFALFVLLVNICTSRTVMVVFLFVARGLVTGAFQAAYVYTSEYFPTTIRAVGLGSCSGFARLGAIITPFVAQVLLVASVPLTLVVYAGCSIFCAVSSLFLRVETAGRPMTDSSGH